MLYNANCALILSAAVSALHQCASSQSNNLKHVQHVPNNISQDEGCGPIGTSASEGWAPVGS